MNPLAALAPSLLAFLTTPQGPTQAQIAAAAQAKHDAEVRSWMIGGALAGGALLLFFALRRR